MQERIKKILKGQAASSVIYILLGVCLAFAPISMVNIICKFVFGIFLIVTGLYHVLIYVFEKENATLLDLFSGTVLLVFGIFLFGNPQIVIKMLPILLGALVLVDSIWTVKGCFKLKKHGSGIWKVFLIGSLIFIGLGVVLIVNPFTIVKNVMIFAGAVLLANGVADIVLMILMRQGIKHAVEKIVEEQEAENAEAPGDSEMAQVEVSMENEESSAAEAGESYEPWNGVTAAGNKPEKKSFWKKLKKEKVQEETVPEDVPNETSHTEAADDENTQSDTENVPEDDENIKN